MSTEGRRSEIEAEAGEKFKTAIQRLHKAAGRPSAAKISRLICDERPSDSTVGNILNAKYPSTWDTVERIANALLLGTGESEELKKVALANLKSAWHAFYDAKHRGETSEFTKQANTAQGRAVSVPDDNPRTITTSAMYAADIARAITRMLDEERLQGQLLADWGVLVVKRGPNAGSRYLLHGADPIQVGRHREVDIFLDNTTVSRRHCVFAPSSSGGWTVADTGSLNRTYVNREPVTEPRAIKTGDEIQVGKYRLVFIEPMVWNSLAEVVQESIVDTGERPDGAESRSD